MVRSNSSNLKNKRIRKVVEDSEGESSVCQSDTDLSDYEGYDCSPSESEAEETSPKEKAKKEKPKAPSACVAKPKPPASSKPTEKKKDNRSSKDKKTTQSSSPSKRKKKEYEMFDESDVNIDMSNDNIKPQKIKLTSNLLIECRNIVVDEPDKKKFSYPGIVFIRKMKDDKCFEFNIPLAVGSRVVNAIEIMISEKNKPKKKEQLD